MLPIERELNQAKRRLQLHQKGDPADELNHEELFELRQEIERLEGAIGDYGIAMKKANEMIKLFKELK